MKNRNLSIALIVTGFCILGTLYSVAIPIFEISDEVWHYPFVQHMATHWRLPVQPVELGAEEGLWKQEGSQPPLYYVLAAALTSWVDTSDLLEVRRMNPQAQSGTVRADQQNVNLVVHRPDAEAFPWRGTVLAVHLARFLSVALGAWAVTLTWRLVQRLYPEPTWLAPVAASVHAFTPMAIFISASVNNDALVIPLALATLLQLVTILQAPKLTNRDAVILGVTLGGAMLAKKSALGLILLALATSVWSTWDHAGRPRRLSSAWIRASLRHLLGWGVPALLIAGWWYARNLKLYGDLLGLSAFLNVAGTRAFAPTLVELWNERFSFLSAYWGNFGGLNILLPEWVYTGLNSMALMAGLGLVVTGVTWFCVPPCNLRRLWPFSWDGVTAARAIAWVWPLTVLVSLWRWTSLTLGSQGRLVFPAISIISLGLVLGVCAWIPRRFSTARRVVAWGMGGVLFILSALALPLWIAPAYRLPRSYFAETAPAPTNTMDATFGDVLTLLGYDLTTATVQPGGAVTLDLYWQAGQPTTEDHLIFIHLVGDAERTVAQHDGFPKRGLISTTSLIPGEIWVERYSIPIPMLAYAPDALEVAVGLYQPETGLRLPVTASAATTVESARFGTVQLQPRNGDLEVRFGEGIVLRDYALSDVQPSAGGTVDITLEWLCNAPTETDYTVSIQIVDAAWHKAAQSDLLLLVGAVPTSQCQAGQTTTTVTTLAIASDVPPGLYDLRVILYRWDAAGEDQQVPVVWRSHRPSQTFVRLTQVRVR